jgi:hypothetical protein
MSGRKSELEPPWASLDTLGLHFSLGRVNSTLSLIDDFYSIRFRGMFSPPVCSTILTTRPWLSVSKV